MADRVQTIPFGQQRKAQATAESGTHFDSQVVEVSLRLVGTGRSDDGLMLMAV